MIGFVLWPIAFLAVASTLWVDVVFEVGARREEGTISVQGNALPFSTLVVTVGFILFGLFPGVATIAWPWVPLVNAAARR